MKKGKAKSTFLLILGGILALISIIILIADSELYVLSVVGLIIAVACVITALMKRAQSSTKNTYVMEATFTSIGKYGEGWVGCYFDVNGKQTRIAIQNSVFNPKLLMPGGKYRLTRKNKDDSVIQVERIG